MELDRNTTEARRWAKFPATLLFATGFLWLLDSLFHFNQESVGQQSETLVGALGAFINFAVIPLGCVVIALGILFVQRWALMLGPLLGLYPLVSLSISKIGRIQAKFAEYRSGVAVDSFGDGVMTGLLVLALWATFSVMVVYVWKSLYILNKSQQWHSRPATNDVLERQDQSTGTVAQVTGEVDDGFCSLFPAQGQSDED